MLSDDKIREIAESALHISKVAEQMINGTYNLIYSVSKNGVLYAFDYDWVLNYLEKEEEYEKCLIINKLKSENYIPSIECAKRYAKSQFEWELEYEKRFGNTDLLSDYNKVNLEEHKKAIEIFKKNKFYEI